MRVRRVSDWERVGEREGERESELEWVGGEWAE